LLECLALEALAPRPHAAVVMFVDSVLVDTVADVAMSTPVTDFRMLVMGVVGAVIIGVLVFEIVRSCRVRGQE
jgi:hypothetical protein